MYIASIHVFTHNVTKRAFACIHRCMPNSNSATNSNERNATHGATLNSNVEVSNANQINRCQISAQLSAHNEQLSAHTDNHGHQHQHT